MTFKISFKKLALLFIIFMVSHFGEAQVGFRKAKIIRNCTGTYLQIAGNNYLVCNADILNEWKENKKVKVQTRILTTCPAPEGEICALYFEYKEIVQITRIKMKRKRIG